MSCTPPSSAYEPTKKETLEGMTTNQLHTAFTGKKLLKFIELFFLIHSYKEFIWWFWSPEKKTVLGKFKKLLVSQRNKHVKKTKQK